jgi:hypothetical protein
MNAYFADLNVLIEIIFAEESFVNDCVKLFNIVK